MTQANVSRLVSALRLRVYPGHRRLKNPKGPQGRHEIIRKIVTGLFKYERLELNYTKADEARGYAERLISEAIRYGDCHKRTMELADYWIEEKQVVHKLFKVLVPRFENCTTSYTRVHKVTGQYPDGRYPRTLLELRGNPYPKVNQDLSSNRNWIHNVLLDEAKKEYRAQKYTEMADQIISKDNVAKSEDVESVTKSMKEVELENQSDNQKTPT